MKKLQESTFKARERTSKNIATRVKNGLWQVVEVVYKDGKTIENELSEWVKGSEIINELNKV